MANALRELLAIFDVQVEDKQLKDFETNTLGGAIAGLKEFGTILAGAFGLEQIGSFVKDTIRMGAEMNDMSDRLGLATDQLQEWQYAARLAGVDAETAAHSLGLLNRHIGDAINGGQEGKKVFNDLGVEFQNQDGSARDTSDVLADVADKMQGLGSNARQTAYLTKLFGRQGAALVPIFKNGSKGLEALRQEFEDLGGGMSKDFIKAADAADDQMVRLDVTMKGFKSTIVNAILPKVIDWLKMLTKWGVYAKNTAEKTTIVKSAMVLLGGAGGFAMLGLSRKMLGLLGLISKTDGSLLGLLKGLGKFGLYAAGIAALILLFDDLYALINGDDSAIGTLMDSLGMTQEKTELVNALKTAWDDVKTAVDDAWQSIKGLGEAIKDASGSTVLGLMLETFVKIAKTISTAVETALLLVHLAGALPSLFKGEKDQNGANPAVESAIKKWEVAMNNINMNGYSQGVVDAMNRQVNGANGPSAEGETAPNFVMAGNAPPNWVEKLKPDVQQTNNITVTVQKGATDDETGDEILQHIKKAQTDANNDAWHGGVYK